MESAGKGVETYWAGALARGALDLAQVLDTILDALARHQVVEGIAGVACRVILAGRVNGAVRDTGAARGRSIDSFVDAVVDSCEALRVCNCEVVGDILNRADDGVVAVGADWDDPLEVEDGVVGKGIIKIVTDRSLVKRRSMSTSSHETRYAARHTAGEETYSIGEHDTHQGREKKRRGPHGGLCTCTRCVCGD